ncbi:MAG: sugar ABC transporter permease [Oscillospiraceae bacterium]|nr:sugar ABC transporter permease [Oscillospiraceae bacterium]
MSDKKNKVTRKLIAKNRDAYILAAPFLLLFLAFTVVPTVLTVVMPFFSYDMVGFPKFSGLENFRLLFTVGDEFSFALTNTAIIFLAVGLGGFVLSFAAAWGLEHLNKRAADIFTAALFIISFVGTVTAAVWLSGGLRAPLNTLLLSMGLTAVPEDWLSNENSALWCVIFSQIWTNFGIGFLALRAGFRCIDPEKTDAARLEGVRNPLWTLFNAQIPSFYPHIAFAAAVQLSYSLTNSEILRILTGTSANDYGAYGIMTYILSRGSEFDAGRVYAANLILLGIMWAVYAVVRIIINSLSKSV